VIDDPEDIRPGLRAMVEARRAILDERRPDAVARRRKRGRWTARAIDPANTRDILLRTRATLPAPLPRTTRKQADRAVLRSEDE
jgi:hypothetical protein